MRYASKKPSEKTQRHGKRFEKIQKERAAYQARLLVLLVNFPSI